MRLVIDLQPLQTESKYRGIGNYSLALTKEIISVNTDHEIYLVINDYDQELVDEISKDLADIDDKVEVKVFSALLDTAEVIPSNLPNIIVSEALRESFINSLNPDFVLISSLFEGAVENFVSSVSKEKTYKVGVIGYDLIPLSDKDKYLGDINLNNWYHRKVKSVYNSDFIYSISESAKREFEKYLSISSEKIVNISSACESIYCVIPDELLNKKILLDFQVVKKFVLYSGALDERKNVKGLLSAFSKLDKEVQQEYQILLVGKYSYHDKSELDSYVAKLSISSDTIKYTGFISSSDLAMLYNLCSAFVFPSYHEGFGLPVLEAMSCGAPTICSSRSSLPEVIGDVEAMFEPSDIDDIKDKLTLVLKDEQFREQRRVKGLEKAMEFSWAASAKLLLRHIEKSLEGTECSSHNYENEYKNLLNKVAEYVSKYSLTDTTIRQISKCISRNEIVLSSELPNTKYNWRIEGPFDSSYSLALLNRETARALKSIGQEVTLYSTEGPGDFLPNQVFLEQNPDIYQMYVQGLEPSIQDDIVSRNLYPPRVTGMQGKYNILHHYAWEESGFPNEWVDDFNNHLSGMTCLSNHVKKAMIDNGVALPLYTSGCGVDHWSRVLPSMNPFPIKAKKFKFLHVSSCFPRKGVDVLLEAYGRSFTSDDDVSLVIKTFDNPHNEVSAQLENLQKVNTNFPDVFILKQDLTDSELKSIYEQCDVLVSPSKAEGFGLPMAEAILSGLPVLTTAWGGQRDFCTHENSWLIDYKFELADTHFELYDSVWAQPNLTDLSMKMIEIFEAKPEVLANKVAIAKKLLASEFSWEKIAINLVNQTKKITQKNLKNKLKIGWVSTWNQKCGIATYSEHLVEQNKTDDIYIFAPRVENTNFADEKNVYRCWNLDDRDNLKKLYESIIGCDLDIVVIQMNYYFYDYASLKELLIKLKKQNIVVFLTLHSTQNPEEKKMLEHLVPVFQYLDRVMVHTVNDLNRLKSIGLVDNVLLLPHGILDKKPGKVDLDTENTSYIASYGFALPHKGIEQLIDAFGEICKVREDVKLLLMNAEHPDPTSKAFIKDIRTKIEKQKLYDKVILNTEFLPDDISLGYLSKAEVVVMPYQNTGESSSGAVKMAIASGAPVLVTPIGIFDDVKGAVKYLDGFEVQDIVMGIQSLKQNSASFNLESVRKWSDAHSYPKISAKLFKVLRSLYINNV